MNWVSRQLARVAHFEWFWWLVRAITNNLMVLNRCWFGKVKTPRDSE